MNPRWRLTAPHYLNVPGTEWEYSEVDTRTGRPKRTRFHVPTFLDPSQPPSLDHPNGKNIEIIVCHGEPTQQGDIQFDGPPTPDMVPLNEEAITISQELEKTTWKHPINSLSGTFGEHLERQFEAELVKVRQTASPQPMPEVAQLLAAVTAMMQQNQQMMQMMMHPQMRTDPSLAPEQTIDNEEPLPPPPTPEEAMADAAPPPQEPGVKAAVGRRV